MGSEYLLQYGNLDIKKKTQISEFMGYGPTIEMTIQDHPSDPTRNIMVPWTVKRSTTSKQNYSRWFIQTDPKLIISFPKALHTTKEFLLWRAIRHPNRPGIDVMIPCGNINGGRFHDKRTKVLDKQRLE